MSTATTDIDIEELNRIYQPLNPIQRLRKVFGDFDHEDILVTSSFGTTSGILMGMVSKAAPGHPIHFIDTTFCFNKTISYKQTLTMLLGLNIINVLPDIEDNTWQEKLRCGRAILINAVTLIRLSRLNRIRLRRKFGYLGC